MEAAVCSRPIRRNRADLVRLIVAPKDGQMGQFLMTAVIQGLKSAKKRVLGNENTDVTKQEAKEESAVTLACMLKGLLGRLCDLSKDVFHECQIWLWQCRCTNLQM